MEKRITMNRIYICLAKIRSTSRSSDQKQSQTYSANLRSIYCGSLFDSYILLVIRSQPPLCYCYCLMHTFLCHRSKHFITTTNQCSSTRQNTRAHREHIESEIKIRLKTMHTRQWKVQERKSRTNLYTY